MTQPTPLEKKRMLGNPGKRPLPDINDTTPLPMATTTPTPPDHLGDPGRAVWERLWQHAAAWVSPATDLGIVTRFCEYHDHRTALQHILDAEGLVATGSMGQTVTHPALKELLAVDSAILKMEGRLGFTPADRAALGVAEVKKQSALEQLLEQRKKR